MVDTYIFKQIEKLEKRIDLLEKTLKANNIVFPKPQIIKDEYYPFVLKFLNRTTYTDRGCCWNDDKFEDIIFDNDDVNGFNTAEEAVAYVKAHLEMFPTKTYVYNNETRKVMKVKKNN